MSSCSLQSTTKRCNLSNAAALALRLKVVAIFSIFTACVVGVCIAVLGPRLFSSLSNKRFKESKVLMLLKSFSAGVILGTGFIHILPDAFEALASSCLDHNPWDVFPFAGFTAMLASLLVLALDLAGTAFYKMGQQKDGVSSEGSHFTTGRSDVASESDPERSVAASPIESPSMQLRYTVVAQVLELGMVAHSIIIGVSLGTSRSPCTIKPLVAALTFHQLFEGLALGACLCQAAFKNGSILVMAFAFSITTPVGIVVGVGISSIYDRNSSNAVMVEGLLDAASAGILIYMSLVDLIATDFLSKQDELSSPLQILAYFSLVFGALAMAVLAFWA